jgi:hypothetical protein
LKRWIAAAITAALLVIVLWAGRQKPIRLASGMAETPQQCLTQMFAAAEKGNIPAYLDCFTGEQRTQVEREMAAHSPEEASRALAQAQTLLKGRAVHNSAQRDPQSDQAEVTVERIYAHHHEMQKYHLRRESGVWKISFLAPAEKVQPAVPYGTLVAPVEEEKSKE